MLMGSKIDVDSIQLIFFIFCLLYIIAMLKLIVYEAHRHRNFAMH